MRLNFTMADEETLVNAVRILGETLYEGLKECG
jgi:DNA-binding transcriptional MocR family regulator